MPSEYPEKPARTRKSRTCPSGIQKQFSQSVVGGYTDRADSYYLYPSENNVNDSEMANLPSDMELELALSQQNSTRTPSPQPQLTTCEQLKYNKAQLAKMETFRRYKQACVDALMMMPDHYPEEPFYVRALTELQDVEETMALAGAQINNLENTGPVASGSNLASPREVTTNNGSNNSANQNAPQNQLPPPIMLFIEENYKVQMAVITKEFPKIRSRLTGEFLKLYTDSAEERRFVVQLLKRQKFQFYTIKAKAERPIKVVIKSLPRTTNPEEIKQDLEMVGYTPERVNQLIGRKTKRALSIFLITLPRNLDNLKIFDLKTSSYLSIRVEGYDDTAVTDQPKANLLATNIKNNFVENQRENDNYNQNDELNNTTVNNFLSTPPTSFIEPALPDEIIHYIKHVNAKKAPEKLTVWCALWAGGIIGPYFFKNDEGHNVTVNGDRYRAIITNFFIPELNNYNVQELWFQQDGATCHTARATIDLLKDTFGDRLISRFGPVNWPPRSCDLTPLDYFLWGYVKSLVYADKPQTLDCLEDHIRRVIADIRPQMLEKVIRKLDVQFGLHPSQPWQSYARNHI
ncbi:uncharacterized protein TNCV_1901361 [Trichonephila clavipes]|nr:uncharacterized protein TNCV_1901361 [Trichonephila clavipes]